MSQQPPPTSEQYTTALGDVRRAVTWALAVLAVIVVAVIISQFVEAHETDHRFNEIHDSRTASCDRANRNAIANERLLTGISSDDRNPNHAVLYRDALAQLDRSITNCALIP